MCKRLMAAILVLGVLFAPAFAFADDGFGGSDGGDFSDRVIYGPNVLDIQSGTYGVQVYAGNKFNAALCVLGYDGSDPRFTNDVKAYLSNESTGGSFYEFSNLFTNNNNPSFGGFDAYNMTFSSAIGTSNTLYGAEFVWIARYTDTLRQAAYARVQDALDGNTGGGSGETGELPNTITVDRTNYCVGTTFGTLPDNIFQEVTANATGSYIDRFKQYMTARPYLLIYARMQNNSHSVVFTLACSSSPWEYKRAAYGSATFDGFLTQSLDVWRVETRSVTANTANVTAGAFNYITHDTTGHNMFPNSVWLTLPTNYAALYRFQNMAEPVVPPTQWPEPDPVTPTEPPEVPSPTPTEPPTEPTTPQFGIPQLPNIGLTTEPTYQTADLTAVLDAMAKHCQHLQTCMTECFDSYYSAITQYEKSIQENQKEFLRSWFRVTLDTIRDCFDDLSDYLQRLFTWLADQMDFTFTGGDYDDSSILWWLKRIYSKLGSGTTVRPTDPVVDPKGIGDWFDQLIKNFIAALLGLGQEVLSDVGDMVEDLTDKFPFSIPWDIAALLALFVATPQIPVLEIPQYALTGNGVSQVGMYTIDLTPYDGVMEIARSIEKVVFAFWLAWKIDFFKAIFNGIVGGDK